MSKNTPKTLTYNGDWQVVASNSFIRDSSFSANARLLYYIIKGYVGPYCAQPFPSLEALSRHLGRPRKVVQRCLSELESRGVLKRHHVKDKGKFTSTKYTLFDTKAASKKPKTKHGLSVKTAVPQCSTALKTVGPLPAYGNGPTKGEHSKVIPTVLGEPPADAPPQTNKVLIPFANPLAQAHEVNPCANGHATESLQRGESEGELRNADERKAG
jgi:DNA-binding transcriptional regulator YhcF (GntR family)